MPDFETLQATLEVRYVPDGYTKEELAEGASWPLGAGEYIVGANVNGAFLPLGRYKGGGVQKKLAAAKAKADAAQAAAAAPGTAENDSTA